MSKHARGFKDFNLDNTESRPDDLVEIFRPGKEYEELRLIGEVVAYATRWVSIYTKEDKKVNVPRVALNFDRNTSTFDDTVTDPYMSMPNEVSTSVHYYVNAIVRDIQDEEPKKKPKPSKKEAKTGVKEKNSDSWTPVRVLRLPVSVARELRNLIGMNVHRTDKKSKPQSYELSHPEFGTNVHIRYDAQAPGTTKYGVQKGDHAPLTSKEKEYLVWDISDLMSPKTLEEAEKDAKELSQRAEKGWNSEKQKDKKVDEYENDEDMLAGLETGRKGGKKRKKDSKTDKKGGKKGGKKDKKKAT